MNTSLRTLGLALTAVIASSLWGALPAEAGKPIADRYILTFDADVDVEAEAASIAREHGARVLHTYRTAFRGAAVELPAAALSGVARRPGVLAVEQDQVMSIDQTLTTQPNATFGLDRVNQRTLPLDGTYSYALTASGVRVYIIDTGVLASHVEFNGRVLPGYTVISDGRGTTDANGHGTHVAGTVAGGTYGVAKGASIVPVRVLDATGSGSTSGVIAGVDWVAAHAPAGSVANLSLGGGASSAMDTAIANLVTQGVVAVVAAGNANVDACTVSPARTPAAITVGATTSTDARASYSNFGSCVDVFAPGSGITSAWYTSNTALNTISGTSMAAPHVAGVAALLRAANTGWTPAQVDAEIKRTATAGAVGNAGAGSTTALLYSLPVQPEPTRDVAVASLSGTTAKVVKGSKTTWTWTITAKAYDIVGGTSVANATISGVVVAGGKSITVSCITGTGSSCTMPAVSMDYRTVSSASFSVRSISGTSLNYKPEANTTNSLTVMRP